MSSHADHDPVSSDTTMTLRRSRRWALCWAIGLAGACGAGAIVIHGDWLRTDIFVIAVIAVGLVLFRLSSRQSLVARARSHALAEATDAARDSLRRADEAEQRLGDLQHELDERSAEMERFVYAVSHDLKSPIVTILGYSSHLVDDLRRGQTDELLDHAARIRRAADRLRSQVDMLLELSRIGRFVQSNETIDLATFVAGIRDAVIPDITAIDVVTEFRVASIEMDVTQATQVVQNLLENAVKYGCPNGAGRIELTATEGETGGLLLSVRDHGPGIPPDHRERVFGLFERLSPGSIGHGVGLAIVRRVVEINNGTVIVEETPGGGATFRVALPSVIVRSLNITGESVHVHH